MNYFYWCINYFFIGFYDDKKGLMANLKLIIITLLIVVLLIIDEDLNISNLTFYLKNISTSNAIPFTALCFIIFINAFNMFDGIDLQASLYSFVLIIVLIFKFTFLIWNLFIISNIL